MDRQREFYQAGYSNTPVFRSRRAWLSKWFPSQSRVDLAVSLLPGGCRLLDVGCGDGELLLKAASRYQELYGVDIAPVQIGKAQDHLSSVSNQRVHLQLANIDADGLPFENSQYDAVTMISVLQFCFDVHHALREIHRVLSANGTLVLEANNLAYLGHRVALLLGRQPRTSYFHGWDGNTLHYFVLTSLASLLTQEGFAVHHVCSAGRFSKARSKWPSLLAQNIMIAARRL